MQQSDFSKRVCIYIPFFIDANEKLKQKYETGSTKYGA